MIAGDSGEGVMAGGRGGSSSGVIVVDRGSSGVMAGDRGSSGVIAGDRGEVVA